MIRTDTTNCATLTEKELSQHCAFVSCEQSLWCTFFYVTTFDLKACRRKHRRLPAWPLQARYANFDNPERVADAGTDPRAELERSTRRCARRLKRSARRHAEQLQCTCPGGPQTLSDELTKSITCRTELGAYTA